MLFLDIQLCQLFSMELKPEFFFLLTTNSTIPVLLRSVDLSANPSAYKLSYEEKYRHITQINRSTLTKPRHSKPEKKVAISSGRNKSMQRTILKMMISPEKEGD